jgi:hypothetical protein
MRPRSDARTTDVTVLYLEGCPSWRTAVDRVRSAAQHAGVRVRVRTRAVATEEDASRSGFTGSPTILVGGQDPFARPGDAPALPCRIHRTTAGTAGSRTVAQLVEALTREVAPT